MCDFIRSEILFNNAIKDVLYQNHKHEGRSLSANCNSDYRQKFIKLLKLCNVIIRIAK